MITVVVLAYNEEAAVGTLLEELDAALRARPESYRFVVVDDGSTDKTAAVAGSLSARLPVTLLRHERNLGVGRAFDTGLRFAAADAAAGDVIVTMEGDRTNDPSRVNDLLDAVAKGSDVVCASRLRRGGGYSGFPLKRLFFSLAANWVMRLLFPIEGVRDYTLFYRAYRAGALQRAIQRFGGRFIERKGFTSNAEILYKVNGALQPMEQGGALEPVRCDEVPVVYRYDRKPGASKMRVGKNIREYGRLFADLLAGDAGIAARQSLAMTGLGLLLGLWGIGWGLPAEDRLAELLPPALSSDAGFRRRLSEHWRELYGKLEESKRVTLDPLPEVEVPPGWSFPPEVLLNSYRSYFLRSCNPDEQKNLIFLANMRPRQLKFDPYGVGYGGAYLYPLGAWYAAAAAVRIIRVTSDVGFYLDQPRQMARIFLVGRLFNALCFAACAALLAALGRRLAGPSAGWAAGLLFLALPATAIVGHTLNPYGWATLWCLAGYRWLARYLERGEDADLAKSAAALGMCIGSSIAYWPVSLAVPLAACLRWRSGSPWRREVRGVRKAAIVSAAVFVLTNPYLFLKFGDYKGEIDYTFGAFPFVLSPGQLWRFLTDFLGFNMGLLAAPFVVVVAFLQALWPGVPAGRRLMSLMFLVGFLQLATRVTDPQHARHFMPFFALGCLAAACAACDLKRVWGAALAAALVLPAAAVAASHLWNMGLESRGDSTRLEAARWINANIPQGRSIGLAARPQPYDTPPFRFDRFRLVLFRSPWPLRARALPDSLPDYVVVSEQRRDPYFIAFLEARYAPLAAFEARRLFPWAPVRSLDSMTNTRIEVLVRK